MIKIPDEKISKPLLFYFSNKKQSLNKPSQLRTFFHAKQKVSSIYSELLILLFKINVLRQSDRD
jgi:hypothetical protein